MQLNCPTTSPFPPFHISISVSVLADMKNSILVSVDMKIEYIGLYQYWPIWKKAYRLLPACSKPIVYIYPCINTHDELIRILLHRNFLQHVKKWPSRYYTCDEKRKKCIFIDNLLLLKTDEWKMIYSFLKSRSIIS